MTSGLLGLAASVLTAVAMHPLYTLKSGVMLDPWGDMTFCGAAGKIMREAGPLGFFSGLQYAVVRSAVPGFVMFSAGQSSGPVSCTSS